MPAKTIYIFRHGQTDYNAAHRAMGRLDIPLNDVGRAQAAELAAKMADTGIVAIYSSPLARAMQTAQAVSARTGAPIFANDDLMERNMGALQGHIVRTSDNPAEYKMDFSQMELCMPAEWVSDDEWRPDGGETNAESFNRARRAVMDIITNSPYDTIAISTHSGPVRATLEMATGTARRIDNCDYIKLVFDGRKLMISQ